MSSLIADAKLSDKRMNCQEKSSQWVYSIFLLDETLLLRYNLLLLYSSLVLYTECVGKRGRSLLLTVSSPDRAGERNPAHPSGDHSGVVQQAGHAALDRRIGVRIPAPEFPHWQGPIV
jgi:hypothetical protein